MSTELDISSPPRPLSRNFPWTKATDFNGRHWIEQPFEEMDSTLAVQQWIQQIIKRDPSDIETIITPPEGQNESVWRYEHLRQFCCELNILAFMLQGDCDPATCSKMTATEQWIFLCAVHKTPRECSAIDYTRHTLDGAATLLNSTKHFASRVSLKDCSVAKLPSVSRRINRIFSHAYFHHQPIFEQFEARTHLCQRFNRFVVKYSLIPLDNLIVPIGNQQNTELNADYTEYYSTPVEDGQVSHTSDSSSAASSTLETTVIHEASIEPPSVVVSDSKLTK